MLCWDNKFIVKRSVIGAIVISPRCSNCNPAAGEYWTVICFCNIVIVGVTKLHCQQLRVNPNHMHCRYRTAGIPYVLSGEIAVSPMNNVKNNCQQVIKCAAKLYCMPGTKSFYFLLQLYDILCSQVSLYRHGGYRHNLLVLCWGHWGACGVQVLQWRGGHRHILL